MFWDPTQRASSLCASSFDHGSYDFLSRVQGFVHRISAGGSRAGRIVMRLLGVLAEESAEY